MPEPKTYILLTAPPAPGDGKTQTLPPQSDGKTQTLPPSPTPSPTQGNSADAAHHFANLDGSPLEDPSSTMEDAYGPPGPGRRPPEEPPPPRRPSTRRIVVSVTLALGALGALGLALKGMASAPSRAGR